MKNPPSHLLALPFEIRRAIYADVLHLPWPDVHVTLHQGRIRVSQCLGTDVKPEDLGFNPYREHGTHSLQQIEAEWGRRLNSSWGNHCVCEEAREMEHYQEMDEVAENSDHAIRRARNHMDMLYVCKQM